MCRGTITNVGVPTIMWIILVKVVHELVASFFGNYGGKRDNGADSVGLGDAVDADVGG